MNQLLMPAVLVWLAQTILPVAIVRCGIGAWIPRVRAEFGRKYFGETPSAAKHASTPSRIVTWILTCAAFSYFTYFFRAERPWIPACIALILVCLYGIVRLDAAFKVIPDRFHLIGALAAFLVAMSHHGGFLATALWTHIALGLAVPLVLTLITFTYEKLRQRDGMGFGDIKLLAWLGIICGPDMAMVMGMATLGALLFVCLKALLQRSGWREPFAFGPLIVGAFVVYWAQ